MSDTGGITPGLDLSTAFDRVVIPSAVISGGTTVATLRVKITNSGTETPAGAGAAATVRVFAVSGAGGDALLLGQMSNVSLAGVRPGATKIVTMKVRFPLGLSSGAYTLAAGVALQAGEDNDPTNDAAVSPFSVDVVQGYRDLAVSLGKISVRPALIAGAAANGSLQVKVSNLGNLATAAGAVAVVKVAARPVGGGPDIPLSPPTPVPVGGLRPNQAKAVTVAVPFPADLPAGQYQLVAVVTGLAEDPNPDNDSVVAPAAVAVTAPFVDLVTAGGMLSFSPGVPGAARGTATLTVQNQGNIPAAGYRVEVYATQDAVIVPTSFLIGTADIIKSILPGNLAVIPVTVDMPDPLVQTQYVLMARVVRVDDGTAATPAGGQVLGRVTATASAALLPQLPAAVRFDQAVPLHLVSQSGTAVVLSATGKGYDAGGGAVVGNYIYTLDIWVPDGEALITLTPAAGGPLKIRLYFNNVLDRPISLLNRTLMLTRSALGSTGAFQLDVGMGVQQTPVRGYFRLL
jgi:hypothetical protein